MTETKTTETTETTARNVAAPAAAPPTTEAPSVLIVDGIAIDPTSKPAPEPGSPEARSREGFTIINPLLPVYRPLRKAHVLRGYPLARQEMPGGAFYYVVQLTAKLEAAVRNSGEATVERGEMVVVRENTSLVALALLLPTFNRAAPNGQIVVTAAYEIIIDPVMPAPASIGATPKETVPAGWVFRVSVKRIAGVEASAVKQPPSFALADEPLAN